MKTHNFFSLLINISKKENGAVAIEAAFSFFLFFLICALLMDSSDVMLKESYVSRVSSSLANILRERKSLYAGREKLTQDDVSKLYTLSQKMMPPGYRINKDYFIDVKAVYFNQDKNKNNKTISETQYFKSASHSCENSVPQVSSALLTNLSSFEQNKGWLPVYQISVCLPGAQSYYKKALNVLGWNMPNILIKNAVIARRF